MHNKATSIDEIHVQFRTVLHKLGIIQSKQIRLEKILSPDEKMNYIVSLQSQAIKERNIKTFLAQMDPNKNKYFVSLLNLYSLRSILKCGVPFFYDVFVHNNGIDILQDTIYELLNYYVHKNKLYDNKEEIKYLNRPSYNGSDIQYQTYERENVLEEHLKTIYTIIDKYSRSINDFCIYTLVSYTFLHNVYTKSFYKIIYFYSYKSIDKLFFLFSDFHENKHSCFVNTFFYDFYKDLSITKDEMEDLERLYDEIVKHEMSRCTNSSCISSMQSNDSTNTNINITKDDIIKDSDFNYKAFVKESNNIYKNRFYKNNKYFSVNNCVCRTEKDVFEDNLEYIRTKRKYTENNEKIEIQTIKNLMCCKRYRKITMYIINNIYEANNNIEVSRKKSDIKEIIKNKIRNNKGLYNKKYSFRDKNGKRIEYKDEIDISNTQNVKQSGDDNNVSNTQNVKQCGDDINVSNIHISDKLTYNDINVKNSEKQQINQSVGSKCTINYDIENDSTNISHVQKKVNILLKYTENEYLINFLPCFIEDYFYSNKNTLLVERMNELKLENTKLKEDSKTQSKINKNEENYNVKKKDIIDTKINTTEQKVDNTSVDKEISKNDSTNNVINKTEISNSNTQADNTNKLQNNGESNKTQKKGFLFKKNTKKVIDENMSQYYKHKYNPIRWTKVTKDNSIWESIHKEYNTKELSQIISIEELLPFEKKEVQISKVKKETLKTVFDVKKGNAIGIAIGRIKMSDKEFKKRMFNLEDEYFTENMLKQLIINFPTQEEIKVLTQEINNTNSNAEYKNGECKNNEYRNDEYKNDKYKNGEYKNNEYRNDEYKNDSIHKQTTNNHKNFIPTTTNYNNCSTFIKFGRAEEFYIEFLDCYEEFLYKMKIMYFKIIYNSSCSNIRDRSRGIPVDAKMGRDFFIRTPNF
ncbi:hypothetical protein BDAP_002709 [Binucleata daphniae]